MSAIYEDLWSGELDDFIFGPLIGEGQDRQVYVFRPDPTRVIKVERPGVEFANVAEWALWHEAKHAGVNEWFASCFGISLGGNFLVQARTEPVSPRDLPERLPSFFCRHQAQQLRSV
ncbi:hypothetical protein F1188_16245 [Roseospira marina]|uniref:Uncharacterized protein n=1 Tax=Roseospira marina TaxID=140057 RepID=A0A5M6I832_9PROT|nr:hypothetical protein [Roseospira marina]KAA5604410.1 hypothetical protein F1188_16245 [Roseospira marina]MBB4315398.1 hypothetical protein [Roseospira marina]MBB5088457.1 hypothetical protein [Roseospira marina]